MQVVEFSSLWPFKSGLCVILKKNGLEHKTLKSQQDEWRVIC